MTLVVALIVVSSLFVVPLVYKKKKNRRQARETKAEDKCVAMEIDCTSIALSEVSHRSDCSSSAARCVPGALLHPPHPHRHPPVLPGAGGGSEDPARQHRGVELRVPAARRHWGLQPDGKKIGFLQENMSY